QLGGAVNQTCAAQGKIERPNQICTRGYVDRAPWQPHCLLRQANLECNTVPGGHRKIVHIVVDEYESSISIRAHCTSQGFRILCATRSMFRQNSHHWSEVVSEVVIKLMQHFQFAKRWMHLSEFAKW